MVPSPLYRNRTEAGHILADYVNRRGDYSGAVVIALARGGVPVADELARELDAPLEVVVVRRIRLPDQPDIVMGAVAEGCVEVIDQEFASAAELAPAEIRAAAEQEHRAIEKSGGLYRGAGIPSVSGRTVLLVDDGIKTGYSMRAAVAAVRRFSPRRIAVAVPIGSRPGCSALASEVDDVICPFLPGACRSVADWYGDYAPPSDDEVVRRLSRSPFARTRRLRAA